MSQENDTRKFCTWILKRSYLSPHSTYILSNEGGYEGLVANLESFLWEREGNYAKAFNDFMNYLAVTYQNEYRRNVLRFNVYDHYDFGGGEETNGEERLGEVFNPINFSTLGEYLSGNTDTPLGGAEVGESGSENFGGFRAVPTPHGGDYTTVEYERHEHYEMPDIKLLLPDEKVETADGKRNPSLRETWERWLAKRTDEEKDIIAVWIKIRSFNEVADLLGVSYEEVDRVRALVQMFGQRHGDKFSVQNAGALQ